MNWKNRKIIKLSGGTFNSNLREVAVAVNINADVLQEACNKIEELQKEIEFIKGVTEKGQEESK